MPEITKKDDPAKTGDKDNKSISSPAKSNLPKPTPKDHEFETIVAKFFEKNKRLKEIEKPMGQMTSEEKIKYSSLVEEIENDKYLIRKTSITEIQDSDPKSVAVWNHLQNENLQTSVTNLIESLKAETLQMRREQRQDLLDFKESIMQKECLTKNPNPIKNIIEPLNQYDDWTPKGEQPSNQDGNPQNIAKRNLSPSNPKQINKFALRNQPLNRGGITKNRHDPCMIENKKINPKDKNIRIEKKNPNPKNVSTTKQGYQYGAVSTGVLNQPISNRLSTTEVIGSNVMNSLATDLEKNAPLSAHEIINQNTGNSFTTPIRAVSESDINEIENQKGRSFEELKRERMIYEENNEEETSDEEFEDETSEQFITEQRNRNENLENHENEENQEDDNFHPESNINHEHISPVKSEMSLVTDGLINALNRMNKQSPYFQSMDPGKIKPWKFDDERAAPAFIEEFESVTDTITDTMQKASYFRKLFKIELFPRCQTMPRNSNYEELKSWFLKVAWSKTERKRRIQEIRKMTMESTKFSIVSQYIAYINAKLEQCQETPLNRIHIIKKKLPLHMAIMSEPSWYSSPDKLINSLIALEKRNSTMEVGEQFKRQSKGTFQEKTERKTYVKVNPVAMIAENDRCSENDNESSSQESEENSENEERQL
ncbi:hypothetical protein V9T40_000610 [Parthenolecanium corni]|uniref:Uncharacterized protein n=1 Tax=Parthenolecanium corni TaxID=536013 RepID=A0AAN9TBC4_9HEMI